uniref:Uncharacterized protein n=1 Tax=Parascaris univalens TaxID=6257 RepID=A0A915BYF2_PARUN
MVDACLEKDHRQRADIIGISSLITERFMLCLDDLLRAHASKAKSDTSKSLQKQRETTASSTNSTNTQKLT